MNKLLCKNDASESSFKFQLIQVRIDTPMTLDKTLPVTALTPNQMKRRPLSFDDKVPQFKVIKIESKNLGKAD